MRFSPSVFVRAEFGLREILGQFAATFKPQVQKKGLKLVFQVRGGRLYTSRALFSRKFFQESATLAGCLFLLLRSRSCFIAVCVVLRWPLLRFSR